MLKIALQIGSLYNRELVVVVTDAPEAYDGFGTFTLKSFDYPIDIDGQKTKGNARIVMINREHLDWQCGRYYSGLYSAIIEMVEEYFSEEDVVRELLNRLMKRGAQ